MRCRYLILSCLFFISIGLKSQQDTKDIGRFSGDLQLDGRVFVSDSAINAAGTPFFDYLKSSADSWLSLNYSRDQLSMGVRFDMFNNSPTFSGGITEANGTGIGMWYIRQKIQKLTVQAGYIYEQFGSGTTFRAYENRGLAIDNPLVGLYGKYELTDNITIKAIAGKQKDFRSFVNRERRFVNTYAPFIKGINTEGFFRISKKVSTVPGASFVNRTIDKASMDAIAGEINKQPVETRFLPKYNNYAYSIYNTLNVSDFAVYLEYAVKSEDVMRDLNNRLFQSTGQVMYGSLSYSRKGFGVNVAVKKTENFDFRTSPLETFNNGVINFLPPQTKQNSYRLLSRYNHNTQLLDELGYQIDVIFKPKRSLTFNANFSNVENDKELLFREIYLDCQIRIPKKKWKLLVGVQAVDYNQRIYEVKPNADYVQTLTPFAEFTWKLDRKKSIRTELQYMKTKRDYALFGKDDPKPEKEQDLGDWLYGLVEFNVAPKYSISVSDMYNLPSALHYYDFSVFYTNKTNRFSLGYAKQVQGIICTGGVCRFENAFSGVKIGVTSSF